MADPRNPKPSAKWLWAGLVVVLAFLAVVIFLNPSGDRDASVEDPIAMPDTGEGPVLAPGEETPPADEAPAPEPFAPGGKPDR